MSAELDVSLESHLLDVLRPLQNIAPAELAEKLRVYTDNSPPSTIPYSVLQAVSRWSRTEIGTEALKSNTTPLNSHMYSMISLLSGTTTSPQGKFGDYIPPKEPEQLEAERIRERKTITALINALLSIGGAAFAAWWAAEKTGWKNEYRVLLALFVAIIVAASESILYLIWQTRRANRSKRPKQHRSIRSAAHKKDDGPQDVTSEPVREMIDERLRRRQ